MKFLLVIISLFVINLCWCQKKEINFSDLGKWPEISQSTVSNDGKFVSYVIDDSFLKSKTLFLKDVTTKWEIRIPEGHGLQFSKDSHYGVFFKAKDTVCIINLRSKSVEKIRQVQSFDLISQAERSFLVYHLKNLNGEMVVLDILLGKEQQHFDHVVQSLVDQSKKSLVIISQDGELNNKRFKIYSVSFKEGDKKLVWQGDKYRSLTFDNTGRRLAFIGCNSDAANDPGDSLCIWYYNEGAERAEILTREKELNRKYELNLSKAKTIWFNKAGDRLFLTLSTLPEFKLPQQKKITIWSYTDLKLPSNKRFDVPMDEVVLGLGVKQKDFVSVVRAGERILSQAKGNVLNDSVFLVEADTGERNEIKWLKGSKQVFFLVSTITGERKLIDLSIQKQIRYIKLSPDGKYVVFYDPIKKQYFSWAADNGKIVSITDNLDVDWSIYDNRDFAIPGDFPAATCLWVDGKLLINDRYNLWMVDPSNQMAPKNLTQTLNSNNELIFAPALINNQIVDNKDGRLILKAFNNKNKDQSFYLLNFRKKNEITPLFTGPFLFGGEYNSYDPISSRTSENKSFYLTTRQSATQYPNIYLTSNFKEFKQITALRPDANYNWYSTELRTCDSVNNMELQGVLYKPDNFDKRKKYPVIILIYEKMSQNLNQYLNPEPSRGNLDVAYLVSNGYLVFTPDINFKVGEIGESYLNSVLSAINNLYKESYIDSTSIGLQGASLGGYGVNYIITHTNKFAAALSGAGVSNLTSDYTWYSDGSGVRRYLQHENGQYRMGCTIWERPDLYIKNSPIFSTDKVNTPILLLHNKLDENVPYSQGLGFYIGLRRLQKKAWMLEYEGEFHGILNPANQLDFETRAIEFFDLYLKRRSVPNWLRGAD